LLCRLPARRPEILTEWEGLMTTCQRIPAKDSLDLSGKLLGQARAQVQQSDFLLN
jgi:hypothetical protein